MKLLLYIIILCLSLPCVATNTKNNSLNVVIPFGPGGGTDTIFRKLQRFADTENIELKPIYKPGNNGLIGIASIYEANDDLAGIVTFDTITAYSIKNKIDVNNIITIQKNVFGVVTSKDGSLEDFIKNSNTANPIKVGYLLLSQKTIIEEVLKYYKVNHEIVFVPYKSGAELIQNIIGKHVDMGITSLNVLAPNIKTGKMRLLAVDTNTVITDFPNTILLGKLDPKIPNINKGSSIVLPNNNNKLFWENLITKYLLHEDTKADSRINYWIPIRKTVKELEKDLIENKIILGL